MKSAEEFQSGYQTAMEEVHALLTKGEGRTEAYEATLTWVKDALGR